MEQIHKRFTAEQVKVLLKAYCQGTLEGSANQDSLFSYQYRQKFTPPPY